MTPGKSREPFLVTGTFASSDRTFASSDPICQIDTVRTSACCRLLKWSFGSKVRASIAMLMSTRVPMKAMKRSDIPVPFLNIRPFHVESRVHRESCSSFSNEKSCSNFITSADRQYLKNSPMISPNTRLCRYTSLIEGLPLLRKVLGHILSRFSDRSLILRSSPLTC